MADTANNPVRIEAENQLQKDTLSECFMDWVRRELVWYAGSFSFHLLALSALLLLPSIEGGHDPGDAVVLESKAEEQAVRPLDSSQRYDIGDIEYRQPPELNVAPSLLPLAQAAHDAKFYDRSSAFEYKGDGALNGMKTVGSGGPGASTFGSGPRLAGAADIGRGPGVGTKSGSGGDGFGFSGRRRGSTKAALAPDGITKDTERAVVGALLWLARHQLDDGSWSLQDFVSRCKDNTCTGVGDVRADAGATAMGLLPFLATGETHRSNGPYKENILRGIHWLMRHQQPDGNLAKGAAADVFTRSGHDRPFGSLRLERG